MPPPIHLSYARSGWGPWQLASELVEGAWLVVAASQAVIMDCLKGEARRRRRWWQQ